MRRDERVKVLADRVPGRVAENAFRGRVPERHQAFGVDHQDRILRGICRGAEAGQLLSERVRGVVRLVVTDTAASLPSA